MSVKAICRILIAVISSMMAFTACRNVPDGVLNKKEMISLLIDIHKGEGLVDIQHVKFYNDSLRKTLKQSILIKHGVTQAQLDTSFVWYGNHIEDYIEVYDEVIKQLEAEVKAPGKTVAVVYAVGDSIDVWNGASTYRIDSHLPVKNLTFNYSQDDTWQPGDNYTLQFKVANQRGDNEKVKATLFARYEDGEIEMRQGSATSDGWTRIRLVTDSTRMPELLFGSLIFHTLPGETFYLDSVSLVRTRNIPTTYLQRGSQRRFTLPRDDQFFAPVDSKEDSADSDNSEKDDSDAVDNQSPSAKNTDAQATTPTNKRHSQHRPSAEAPASSAQYRPGYSSPVNQSVQQSQLKTR